MDRRCAAGALLALAACIASSAAAPTASNTTALETYDGASKGCYYNFQHYGEGDRIMTNEPCLNCTCHNRMLMCYLRVCPFTKPIGQDCSVEKRADQCCPIVTCPDVPVDLLTSTSTSSPAEYGETGIGKLDRYGCSINGKYFPEGSKVPPVPNKPCEHCYCIRNMTTCVMQECTLHVDGCTPIYHKDVCCPVRYSCDHPEDEILLLDDMTTTVRPTPGFLLTTTTLSPVTQMTQDCVHDDKTFADGALIKTEKACEHCYCMKGDIVCVVQECGTPMENEGKNCTSMPPREGQCCPDTYICEGDELTTESKADFTTTSSLEHVTTLAPPRRVIEGSGYRNEPDEPFTEVPTYEPDTEGSGGEEQESFKPIDAGEMFIPESVTSPPYIMTEQDEMTDHVSLTTTEIPTMDIELTEKTTTEPDKGENTVPSGSIDNDSSKTSVKDTPEEDISVTQSVPITESYFDAKTTAVQEDIITPGAERMAVATEPVPIAETTIANFHSTPSSDKAELAEDELIKTTEPSRSKQDDEVKETTKLKEIEESSTKAGDFLAPDSITTESTIAFIQQESKTTTAQLTDQENEVLIKEPTTESNLELSTKSDVINTETEPATTKQPEIVTELSTPDEDHSIDITSINPVDNEIDEESYPTSSPGRIPGEGDCLLDGVTYSNDSIVPSSNNCHTGCKCVSSIVKCDPIICSAPPDYMDNCQPRYDPPECCPTYVCDHSKETAPPQPHSQMSGTESPVSTPAIECAGDQCKISKDKQDSFKPTGPCTSDACSDDTSKEPEKCGKEECQEADSKPYDSHPLGPAVECVDENCNLPQEHCDDGKCESSIKKDQACDSENGCKTPIAQPCQSEDCNINSEISPPKDSTAPCDNPDTCNDSKVPEPVPTSTGLPPKSTPQKTDECKDGSDCTQTDQSPAVEECKEESCRRQQVPDINKPINGDCTDSECLSQDNISQVTSAPSLSTETEPPATKLPEVPGELFTSQPKTTILEEGTELTQTTEASILVRNEEPESTTKYDERDPQKEHQPSTTPEVETQSPEGQKLHTSTETTVQKETTMSQLEDEAKIPEQQREDTPSEETTDAPKSDIDTDNITTEPPRIMENELPESVTESDETLVGERRSEAPPTKPQKETNIDEEGRDITTTEPFIPVNQDKSTKIVQETTESQVIQTAAPEYLDKDKQEPITKEPEYVLDQDEVHTDSPNQLVDNKKPEDKVIDTYTQAPEPISTVKYEEEPVTAQHGLTTPELYDGETNAPEMLETKPPMQEVLEENIAASTVAPEKESNLSQEQELENQKTELPVYLTSNAPTTRLDEIVSVTEGLVLPDMKEEADTDSPISDNKEVTSKPQILLDEEVSTHYPEFTAVSDVELSTKAPVQGITHVPQIGFENPDKYSTEAQEMTTKISEVIEKEQDQLEETGDPKLTKTESPMSIVTEHGDNEISTTQKPDTDMNTNEQELSTKIPEFSESPMPQPTKSEPEQELSAKPDKAETEKDIEQMPSLSDEEHVDVVTEKMDTNMETTILPDIIDDSLQTLPVKESDETTMPASIASNDDTPISVSIVEEPVTSEHAQSVTTEHSIQNPDEQQKETSEVSSEGMDTNAPESFTVLPIQTTPEDKDIITPVSDQTGQKGDTITEIPELTVHEYTESSLTTVEQGPIATEKDTSEAPDTLFTNSQETTSQKEVTQVPDSEGPETNAPERSVTEATDIPQQESVTKTPEHPQTDQSEFTEKDFISSIPETSTTESQKELIEVPETQDALATVPELSPTESQQEATKAPDTQDITTSISEITKTEPEKEVTEVPELQDLVTSVQDITESDQVATEAPESQDITTDLPKISTEEPYKEISETPESDYKATDVPVSFETSSHKATESLVSQDITTTIPEIASTNSQEEITNPPERQGINMNTEDIPTTESQKEATKRPDLQETITEVSEMSTTDKQKDVTEIPETQDSATSLPKVSDAVPYIPSATESQKETTEVSQDASTIPPVVTDSQSVTEIPVVQDTASQVPVIPVTDLQADVTEKPGLHDTTNNIPETSATEFQKEVTEVPVTQDVTTNIPVSEKDMQTQEMEGQYETATNKPDVTEIEPHKDTTVAPEKEDISVPEVTSQEMYTETTIVPQPDGAATDSQKIPITESQKEVTDAPAPAEDITTNIPVIGIQKEGTKAPEMQDFVTSIPNLAVTEPQRDKVTTIPESQDIGTQVPNISGTESHKEATEPSKINEVATIAPEIPITESHKEVTKAQEQEMETKATERTQTDATEKEDHAVTEINEIITMAPLETTTKLEDHFEIQTQKVDPDFSLHEEGQQSTIIDALVTESYDSDATDKPIVNMADDRNAPKEEENLATELPIEKPTKTAEHIEPEMSDITTELSPASIESDTKTTQVIDSESDLSRAPELDVIDKHESTTDLPNEIRTTEAASPSMEEEDIVTESPQKNDLLDKTSQTFKEPEQTSESDHEYGVISTTPYLVLLDEHTHKKDIYTTVPGEEITNGPSDYEPSTPEASLDMITESVSSMATEEPSHEEAVLTDKEHIMPVTETITEPALVSEVITTISSVPESSHAQDVRPTGQPHDEESNEILTPAPTPSEENIETEKPLISSNDVEHSDKEVPITTEKPREMTTPEEEFIVATTKATTIKTVDEFTTLSPLLDKFSKPEVSTMPKPEKPIPDTTQEIPKPSLNEVQTTEEAPQPEDESNFPPTGTSSYGQEPDYGEEDQAFGPGTCRYGGKVYVSAQQIPRDDPCDFCFCFRSDIICLQQSCPPPIHGCHEEPIQGFCCPRYECPVSMATTLNVTTTTTTTTTTLPPHFLHHAYKGAAERRGCQIKGHTYKVGEVVRASSGPCLHCTCGGDGQMKCDPKVCTPEPMLRQMIAAAVSAKRRR